MKDLTMMKRLTNLRDDFIEDAYLPDPVPVVPVKPRRTLPILGTPLALVGRIAAASVAGIAVLGVVFGIALPALTDGDETVGESYETASGLSSEALTDTEETDLTETNILIDIQPQTVHPGDTVQITILDPDDRKVAIGFDLCFTYATVPVGRDLLAYVPESDSDPYVYTVTIPENAPVGQYDLTVEWGDEGKILEKVLTVIYSEEVKENKFVWIMTDAGTVYPHYWSYGSRTVYAVDDSDRFECWSYMYSDGVGFMDYYLNNPESLPTVVWSEAFTVCYAYNVMNYRSILVYDENGDEIMSATREDIPSKLSSGIYYFALSGNYYGIDHTEEIMLMAKQIETAWGDDEPWMQDLAQAELEKDPYAFTDKHYCEHLLRVIIP